MNSRMEPISPIDLLQSLNIKFSVHHHAPIRAQADIAHMNQFDIRHSVKTLAFSTSDSQLILAAIPGPERISYSRLAKAAGLKRKDLKNAEPDQLAALNMKPGGLSPICVAENLTAIFDAHIPGMGPVCCGGGDQDQTIELDADDLIRVAPRSLVADLIADRMSRVSLDQHQ